MNELANNQKKQLRAESHDLRPLVHIGKKGLSDELITEVDLCLQNHELLKIKFLDCKEKRKEASNDICKKLNAHKISLVGNILTLYREQEDEEKRKIELPPPKRKRKIP